MSEKMDTVKIKVEVVDEDTDAFGLYANQPGRVYRSPMASEAPKAEPGLGEWVQPWMGDALFNELFK